MRNLSMMAVTALAVAAGPHQAAAATDTVNDGPVMRAALTQLANESVKLPVPSSKSRTDWAAVGRLRLGRDIIVTVRGMPAATRRLLSADAEALVVLDLSDARLSKDARKALSDIAADRPFTLLAARAGEVQLPRHIRATPDGVFVDRQYLVGLDAVITTLPRTQIVDVRVRRKHVGTHSRRGMLIGAAIGAGLGAAIGASSDSDETLPLAGVGALGGGVWGLEIGTVVGVLAPSSPDVIYHVD